MIYWTLVFHLLFIPTFIKCGVKPLDLKFESIVVKAINLYRRELLCDGVENMKFISGKNELVKQILNQPGVIPNGTIHVTKETCGYNITENLILKNNLETFMVACIDKAKAGDEKLSWIWNPLVTDIGCTYQNSKNLLSCLVRMPNQNVFFKTQDLVFDESKKYMDQLKLNKTLSNPKCHYAVHHSNHKSCYLLTDTRKHLVKEINMFRHTLAVDMNYSNIPLVHWSYELEIVAIKISQFYRVPEHFCNYYSDNFKNGIGLYNFPGEFSFGKGGFPRLIQDLEKDAMVEIRNSSDLITRPLFWMYDTRVTAFACTYYLVGESRINKFLCVFNKESSTKITVNLVKGPPCTVCSCPSRMYSSLCTEFVTFQKAVYPRHSFGVSAYFLYILILLVIVNIFNLAMFLKAVIRYNEFREMMLATHIECVYTSIKHKSFLECTLK